MRDARPGHGTRWVRGACVESRCPTADRRGPFSMRRGPRQRRASGIGRILSVLLYHGLRREEPCTLNVRDIYPRRGVRHAPGVCLEPGRRAGMADIRVSARRQIPAQSKRGQDRPSPMRTHREAWRSRTEVGQKRPAYPRCDSPCLVRPLSNLGWSGAIRTALGPDNTGRDRWRIHGKIHPQSPSHTGPPATSAARIC